MAQAKRENAMEVVSLTALIEMKPMTCECMRQWVCVRVRCAWAQDRWKWKRKRNEIQWPKRQPHYHFSIFVMLLLIWHMPCARQMTAKYFDSSSCRVGPRDEKSETKLLERTSEIFLIFFWKKNTRAENDWNLNLDYINHVKARQATGIHEMLLVPSLRGVAPTHHFSVRQTVSMSFRCIPFFFLGRKALKFMNFYCLSASADRQSPFQTLRNTFWCF